MSAGFDGSNARAQSHPSMSAVLQPEMSLPAERVIASRVLGDVVVSTDNLFRFPEGLHGFEAYTEFVLVPTAREGFWWLQAADEAQLAFLLADPFRVSPGYEVDLGEGDIRFLGLGTPEEALVLTVVTLPGSKEERATTNLRGPVVFNTRAQLGRQVVSAVEGYVVNHPFDIRIG